MFYDQLKKLCSKKGITITKLVQQFQMSKGNITRWKNGGTPSLKIITKIAEYFGVSTDYLLTGKISDKNHPENDVTFDDFTYAFMEESGELSEKDKQTLLDMARLMRKRQHEERRDKN